MMKRNNTIEAYARMYIFVFSYLKYENLSRLFAMHVRPNFLVLLYLCIFAFILQKFE